MQDIITQKRETYKKQLGHLIKKHRKHCKKSISLISAEIGMTKSLWADMEKGVKDPQLTTIVRMAEALDIKTSQLLLELENTLGKDFSIIE